MAIREDNPLRPCEDCGDYYEESQMEAIDISDDGEYYPRFIYVCYGCKRTGGGEE